jgi:hypothetical protein
LPVGLTRRATIAIDATELSEIDELGPLQKVEAQLAELLAADEVAHLAAALDPGSTAGVLIWEYLWVAPFASAAWRAGESGRLTAPSLPPVIGSPAEQTYAAVGEVTRPELEQWDEMGGRAERVGEYVARAER